MSSADLRTSADSGAIPAADWPTSIETPVTPPNRSTTADSGAASADRPAAAEPPAAGRATSAAKHAATASSPADRGAEPAAARVSDWGGQAEHARKAAESALKPAVQQLTDAGLPTRRPGAQLAPGAALPHTRQQTGGAFRDASAVRTSLSRHYQGMRAARQQTVARIEESGEDGVEP
jgi:hypothetical protein